MAKGMLAVAIRRTCKGCGREFEARKSQQLFHDAKCKDAWHEAHRYDKAAGTCRHRDGCAEPARRQGWCFMHYQRLKAGSGPGPAERLAESYEVGQTCRVSGCQDDVDARGYCQTHYQRVRMTGTAGPAEIRGRGLPPGHAQWTKGQRHRYYRYGIGPAEFDRILARQNGRCHICRTADPGRKGWSVDHCHETSAVRFIACNPCNTALGLIKESPAVAKRLLEVALECQQLRLI